MKKLLVDVKDYPAWLARSSLSFQVYSGQLLEIRGANGSGKSTLLKALTGSSGGQHQKIRSFFQTCTYQTQLVQESLFLDWTLLDIIRLVRPRISINEVLNLGLLENESILYQFWNNSSGGEKQKTLLTQSLISQHEILFLDEPQNHLDSRSKKVFELCIKRQLAEGTAVVIVTHSPLETLYPDFIISLDADL